MQAKRTRRIGPGLILLVIASLLISAPAVAQSQLLASAQHPGAARPAQAAATFNLCAQPGSVTMPDTTAVTIWGFALDDGSCGNPATLPGYPIFVNEDDVVTVNLTNNLLENVSIIFPGQDLIPDTTGAASGGSVSYTFTASNPGTYLYQAGTNPAVQVAMGLYGALIVRPALGANYAYNDTGTEFDVESMLVLSELDVDLNNRPNPNTFDMLTYKPEYWLINGEAYPDTDVIPVDAADRLLLRYLNAGLMHHTMQLVGARQWVIAKDAYPLLNPFSAVAETLPAGQTADMIVNIPSAATAGTRYPLYNRQLHLTNAATRPGGMMTFIVVNGAGGGPSPTPTSTPTPTPTPTNTPTPTAVPANKHIGDLDWTANNPPFATWSASVVVTVHNVAHAPVAGAIVTGSWSGGGLGGTLCVTTGAGTCVLTRSGIPDSQLSNTFSVTGITGAAGAGPYNAALNHDPDAPPQNSNGTSLTVPRP